MVLVVRELLFAFDVSQAVNYLFRGGAGGDVENFNYLHVDYVGCLVLGVKYRCSLRRDPYDQVLELRTMDWEPDAGWKIKVEHGELGQESVCLGLFVWQGPKSFANGDQGSDELLLWGKAGGATGTYKRNEN